MAFKLVNLVNAIRHDDIKTATSIAESWTMQEREAVAYYLIETANYLRQFNKDWAEALNFPAKNEE